MPSLSNGVVLVTGANGGLGTHFVSQALDRGATKVYATARSPRDWIDPRIVPLELDVTDPESVRRAAEVAQDVTVVINNAGAANNSGVMHDPTASRALFETNYWGPLAVADAFAPALVKHRGALLNVLSVLSWIGIGDTYSATKAALWSATNTQRLELAPQGVLVTGLHLAYADTPMTAGVDGPKNDPADVVRAAYDGIEADRFEVLVDDLSRQVKAGLAAPLEALYPQLKEPNR